jgi:uncharacterized protein CbrC (UPF0167 family)
VTAGASGPQLPEFPYHPDPMGTGAIVTSEAACACCGLTRGYIYNGPVFAVANLAGRLCPWCIADGSAADTYDAHFIGDPVGEIVPSRVVPAVDSRTPGFTAWQDPRWFFHCGDGAMFLGSAGVAELAALPDAVEHLRQGMSEWNWPPVDVEHFLASLTKEGQPTAYVFRCRICATHLAYADFT